MKRLLDCGKEIEKVVIVYYEIRDLEELAREVVKNKTSLDIPFFMDIRDINQEGYYYFAVNEKLLNVEEIKLLEDNNYPIGMPQELTNILIDEITESYGHGGFAPELFREYIDESVLLPIKYWLDDYNYLVEKYK